MTDANEKPEYLLAVDIECTGPQLGRPILAIGAVFGTIDRVLVKRSFCGAVPPPGEFDPDTWKFWSQFPDILKRINDQAEDKHEMHFWHWLHGLEIIYGPFGRGPKAEAKLRLVSDNPGYDLAKIAVRFYALMGDNAKLMSEMFTYAPTSDPTEQQELATPEQLELIKSFITAPHSHEPCDDALGIYQNYQGVQAAKRLMQQK